MTKKEQREVTLRRLRSTKDRTQKEVVSRLQELGRTCSQQQLSEWEKGIKTPSIEVAIDLARAYEVSIIDLLTALGFDLDGVSP